MHQQAIVRARMFIELKTLHLRAIVILKPTPDDMLSISAPNVHMYIRSNVYSCKHNTKQVFSFITNAGDRGVWIVECERILSLEWHLLRWSYIEVKPMVGRLRTVHRRRSLRLVPRLSVRTGESFTLEILWVTRARRLRWSKVTMNVKLQILPTASQQPQTRVLLNTW